MRKAFLCLSILVLFAGFLAGQEQTAELDFHPEEVLFGYGGESIFECYFYVGKVVTPASEKTNNQAQIVAVGDGRTYWSRFIFKTHKAEATELQLAAFVFYPLEFPTAEQIDAHQYRSTDWDLGQVSSLKQLAHGEIEVDGTPYEIGVLRLPDTPLPTKR